MQLIDFIENPDWHTDENLAKLFDWVTETTIEHSGEARRQLGYYDGYNGCDRASVHSDYVRGYEQGLVMRSAQLQIGETK